jgi:hypothetical protein
VAFDFEFCEESVKWRGQKAFFLCDKGPLWVRLEDRSEEKREDGFSNPRNVLIRFLHSLIHSFSDP